MRRAHLERARTLRIWRAHLRLVHLGLPAACPCELQPGRLRKGQRLTGCSLPRCFLCHRAKLLGRATAQEYRAALSHHEWAHELGLHVSRARRPW